MVLTQILVIMCALPGAPCIIYGDVAQGVLSAAACESAIREVAREHSHPEKMTLDRERSFCALMPVNTQHDRDS
jgi:hypothetical protein